MDDHRRAAFVDRVEALLHGDRRWLKIAIGIVDLAAAGAGEIAAEQRLQHQHERIALPPISFCSMMYAPILISLKNGTAILLLSAFLGSNPSIFRRY